MNHNYRKITLVCRNSKEAVLNSERITELLRTGKSMYWEYGIYAVMCPNIVKYVKTKRSGKRTK